VGYLLDSLQLGISLNFSPSELNKLDAIYTKVKKINDSINNVGSNSSGFTNLYDKYGNVMKQVSLAQQEVTDQIKKGTEGLGKFNESAKKGKDGLDQSKKAAMGLGESIIHNTEKMALWASSAFLLYGTFNGVKDSLSTMIDLEMQAINIAKVLPNNNGQSAQSLAKPFVESDIQLAKRFGQSLESVEEATSNWAKQYKTASEVADATRASLLAATATDISFAGSVTDLSSVLAEWGLKASDATKIVDILNEESNNYRITAQGLADALAKTGSAAKTVGLSIEELTGILTVGISTLGMEGREVGTFWTRTMARISGNKSAKEAFKDLGIDTLQPLSDMLNQLAVKWEQMSNVQKQNFAITVAGTQHWSRFIGILDNWKTVQEATKKALESEGSAQKEVNNIMDSTQKKVGQLNAQWQAFIQHCNGVLNIVKLLVVGLTNLISGLDTTAGKVLVFGAAIITLIANLNAVTNAIRAMSVFLYTNPFTLWIGAIGTLAAGLIILGSNAEQATQKIQKMQEESSKARQIIDGLTNKARNFNELSDSYQDLQKKIAEANKHGQSTIQLNKQLKSVEDQLAESMGLTTNQLDERVNKTGGFTNFVNIYLQGIASMINANNELIRSNEKGELAQKNRELQSAQQQRKFALDNLNWTKKYGKSEIHLAQNRLSDWDNYIKQIQSEIAAMPISNLKDITVEDLKGLYPSNTKKFIGGSDLGDEKLEDKISKIISAYNNEIQAVNNKIKAYKKLGLEYDAISEKIQITESASDKISRIAPNNENLIKWTKDLANLKPEQIIQQLEQKMKGVNEQFDASGKAIQFYTEQVNALEIAIKELSKADPNNAKLEKYKNILKELNGELDKQRRIQKEGEKRISQAEEEIKKMGLDNEMPYNRFKDALSTVADALIKFGDSTTQVSGQFINALSQIITESGNVDWKNASPEQKTNIMKSGLDLVMQSSGATSREMKNAQLGSQLGSTIGNMILPGVGGVLGSIQGGILGSLFGKNKKPSSEYKTEIDKMQALVSEYNKGGEKWKKHWWEGSRRDLQATINKLSEALNTSINSITSNLANAFQATNYMDFLTSWNQSLYDMTRQALIKAFISSSAYEGLYKELSNTVTLAVMDGTITADEINAIRSAGNAVSAQMQTLYQALSLLDLGFPGANQGGSGSQSYTAGSSVPISYQVYISINSQAFMGDEDDARTFGLQIWDVIQDEIGRA
jgi:TP901 family phage tail tape measure protein